MYSSRKRRRWRLGLIINMILAVVCLYIGLQIALTVEPISRRLEALPFYARTYLNKLRPQPELPPPPAVSAVDPQALLQTAAQTDSPPASSAQLLEAAENQRASASAGESAVQLVETNSVPVDEVAPEVSLSGFRHEWQTWNNCGPVTIAMNLSYFGGSETQVEAAQFLKPNQEDKNVNPEELAAYAQAQGFEAFVGVGGDIELLKHLLSNDLPVIVETWLDPEDNGGLGHYRLLTGYDAAADRFIAYDSLRGANLSVSMAEFDPFWRVFNRKYLLVYRPEQTALGHAILGRRGVEPLMFEQALFTAQQEAQQQPENAFVWFNMGTNYAHLDQPELAASAFDQARRLGLPHRMLWYQFEIFETYLAQGRYQEVIDLTTPILEATGGLEELYYYRGLARRALNQPEAAAEDLRAALEYNPHFAPAAEILAEMGLTS